VQERIASLGQIARDEGEAQRPSRRPRLGLAAVVFVAVFAEMLLVFMRV
jgi:hypothetical protein